MLTLSRSHYLDVFTSLRELLLEARRVHVTLRVEDDPFGISKGSVAYRCRRIVGSHEFSLPIENIRQSLRAFFQLYLIPHVFLRIDKSQVALQPLLRRRDGHLIDGNWVPVNIISCSIAKDHEHRPFNFPATTSGFHFSRSKESFVDVVVHDVSVTFQIFFGERD